MVRCVSSVFLASHPIRPPTRPTRRSPVIVGLLVLAIVTGCAPGAAGGVAGVVGGPSPTVGLRPTPRPTAVPTVRPAVGPSARPSARPSAAQTSSPTPSASPSPTPTPVPSGPYEVNLYRKDDFVSQATVKQCVAGAMQTMLNIVGPDNDRSRATQASLARLARRLSDARDRGTEPLGWARGLEERGAGAYRVVVEPTMGRAVRRAVEAIRATGRPVGLLVWRGAHSWVLHGFAASADPALTDDYAIHGLWVSDPWYPRVSSIWGPSRKPNQRISVRQLREDYLKWRRPTGRYPSMDGEYVLVLPVADRG